MVGPALWSVSNHLDKYLISKYFKSAGVGSLIIFSSLFGIFVLPFILLIEPNVLRIQPYHIFILWLNSLLYVLGIIAYLYALRKDEASIVVPMFQMIPVFGYVVAYFILGETLNTKQILASLLIIVAAVALSLDLSGTKPKIKTIVLLLMVLSSFLISIGGVLFKLAALEATFWISTFWSYVGLASIGVFLYAFITSYREQFLFVMQSNKIPVIGLNSFNEIINAGASLATSFASLLVPITLVWVVNDFQPFFVFVYGVILTLFFPRLGTESLIKRHVIQKVLAIIVMFVGTYILNS